MAKGKQRLGHADVTDEQPSFDKELDFDCAANLVEAWTSRDCSAFEILLQDGGHREDVPSSAGNRSARHRVAACNDAGSWS